MKVLGAHFEGSALDWARLYVAGRRWANVRDVQEFLARKVPGLSTDGRSEARTQAAARSVIAAGVRSGILEPRGYVDASGWPSRRVRSYKVV